MFLSVPVSVYIYSKEDGGACLFGAFKPSSLAVDFDGVESQHQHQHHD